jgi:hypothetical protein
MPHHGPPCNAQFCRWPGFVCVAPNAAHILRTCHQGRTVFALRTFYRDVEQPTIRCWLLVTSVLERSADPLCTTVQRLGGPSAGILQTTHYRATLWLLPRYVILSSSSPPYVQLTPIPTGHLNDRLCRTFSALTGPSRLLQQFSSRKPRLYALKALDIDLLKCLQVLASVCFRLAKVRALWVLLQQKEQRTKNRKSECPFSVLCSNPF